VKTSSRPKIKFLQLPLSVLSYLRTLTSKAASDLLVYLCQRTIGFGESSVTLTYNKIAEVLEVDSRTVARVAKLLEDKGFISREQTAHRVYRWRVVLQKDDIIADPEQARPLHDEALEARLAKQMRDLLAHHGAPQSQFGRMGL